MVEHSVDLLMTEFPHIGKELIELVFENEADHDFAKA
jgi:hypothetical protein